MWNRIKAELTPPKRRHGVDEDVFWKSARDGTDDAVFTALKDFGTLLVAEAQARAATLDAKSTNLLGWNGAASGFFLTALLEFDSGTVLRWLFVGGAMVTGVGTFLAYRALRIRAVIVPSQEEWLEPELTASKNVFEIRRRHLLQMLRWHCSDCDINAEKGHWAVWAQRCLLVAAIILPVAVLFLALADPVADVGARLVHEVVTWWGR